MYSYSDKKYQRQPFVLFCFLGFFLVNFWWLHVLMYVLEVDSALIDLIKIRSSMLLDMFVNFLCFADQINIIITFNYTFTYSLHFDCFILTL